MPSSNQLAQVIEQALEINEDDVTDMDPSTVDHYKKLNEKCDIIISKVKSRKKTIRQNEK